MERFLFVWLHFNGRIDRRTWLLYAVLITLIQYAIELFLRQSFRWPLPGTASENPFLSAYLGDEVTLLTGLIFLWPSLAIDVKRLHDIGVSGWTVLTVYIPAAVLQGFGLAGAGGTIGHPQQGVAAFLYVFGLIILVYFIVLAARRGMARPNQYGPPPS